MATCDAPARRRRKEDQIARRQLIALDRFPGVVLILCGPRKRHAVVPEHVLREAAAIEPREIAAAVLVRHAAQLKSRAHQRVAVNRRSDSCLQAMPRRAFAGRGHRERLGRGARRGARAAAERQADGQYRSGPHHAMSVSVFACAPGQIALTTASRGVYSRAGLTPQQWSGRISLAPRT